MIRGRGTGRELGIVYKHHIARYPDRESTPAEPRSSFTESPGSSHPLVR